MKETKQIFGVFFDHEEGKHYTRATVYQQEGRICVEKYEYLIEDGDWRELDIREEYEEHLNENFTFKELEDIMAELEVRLLEALRQSLATGVEDEKI